MGKFVLGCLLFVAGIFFSITGIGLILGIPMAVIGMGMMWVGVGQLGWMAVKGGVAAGTSIHQHHIKKITEHSDPPKADLNRWRALVELDADVAKAANLVKVKYGERYETLLAEKYLALGEKQYLQSAVEKVIALAKAEAEKPTSGTIGKSSFIKEDGVYRITQGFGAGKTFPTYDELHEYARL